MIQEKNQSNYVHETYSQDEIDKLLVSIEQQPFEQIEFNFSHSYYDIEARVAKLPFAITESLIIKRNNASNRRRGEFEFIKVTPELGLDPSQIEQINRFFLSSFFDQPDLVLDLKLDFNKILNLNPPEFIGGGGKADVYKVSDSLIKKASTKLEGFRELCTQEDKKAFDKFMVEAKQKFGDSMPFIEVFSRKHGLSEYQPGVDLKEFAQNLNENDNDKLELVLHQLLQALAFMETHNIAHGDLSADNIVINEKKGVIQAKIIDWDSPKKIDNNLIRVDLGHWPSKVTIITPERALYGEAFCMVDNKQDIFALGKLMADIISNKRLYNHNSSNPEYYQSALAPDVIKSKLEQNFSFKLEDNKKQALISLLTKMLAFEAFDRISPVEALQEFEQEVMGGI